jgi:hypothetical protein
MRIRSICSNGFLQTALSSSGNEKSGELSAARDSDALARACPLYELRGFLLGFESTNILHVTT